MTNLMVLVVFSAVTAVMLLFAQMVRNIWWAPVSQLPQLDPTLAEENLRGTLIESLSLQIPMSGDDRKKLVRELHRAGQYHATARHEFLARRNSMVFLAIIATGVLAVLVGPGRHDQVVVIAVIGLSLAGLAWALPRLLLRQVGNRRVARIQDDLPSALDMLTMCTTGGLSIQDALAHVSREMKNVNEDLAFELAVVRQQANMTSLELALKQFARRTDADEIAAMSALISESHRLGSRLATSIQQYADSIRLRARQVADEKAGKAAVALLFPIVLFLLPAILILMWGPAILDLADFLQDFEGVEAVDLSDASNL